MISAYAREHGPDNIVSYIHLTYICAKRRTKISIYYIYISISSYIKTINSKLSLSNLAAKKRIQTISSCLGHVEISLENAQLDIQKKDNFPLFYNDQDVNNYFP